MKIRVPSPAKINLHLDLGPVRQDGFHELRSLFQTIGFQDELQVYVDNGSWKCRIDGPFSCPQEKNLIYRACRLFSERSGLERQFTVTVDKKIPEGAGLGGGSSNAGRILSALRMTFEPGMGDGDLREMAAELGSDVPFFCEGPAAVVSGRGEIIQNIQPRTDFRIALVIPEFAVSTAWAYKTWDQDEDVDHFLDKNLSEAEIAAVYQKKHPSEWPFYNDFEKILYKKYPWYAQADEILKKMGSFRVLPSGSGSTLLGFFDINVDAVFLEKQLKSSFLNSYFAVPLDTNPGIIIE